MATALRWGDRQVRSISGTSSNLLTSLPGPVRRQKALGLEALSGTDFNLSPATAAWGRPERVCPSRLSGEAKQWLLVRQPVLHTPGAEAVSVLSSPSCLQKKVGHLSSWTGCWKRSERVLEKQVESCFTSQQDWLKGCSGGKEPACLQVNL